MKKFIVDYNEICIKKEDNYPNIYDTDKRLIPKKMNHKKIKVILETFYEEESLLLVS